VRSAWKWILAVVATIALVAMWVLLHAKRDKKGADFILLEAAEVWSRRAIEKKQQALAKLKQQAVVDAKAVDEAEHDVAAAKDALKAKYEAGGLSHDEIASRLRALDV